MTATPMLWAIVVCVFTIVPGAALLAATTPLEHLIAVPALNRDLLARQRAAVRTNGKGR